jgi:hypothetical protein
MLIAETAARASASLPDKNDEGEKADEGEGDGEAAAATPAPDGNAAPEGECSGSDMAVLCARGRGLEGRDQRHRAVALLPLGALDVQ